MKLSFQRTFHSIFWVFAVATILGLFQNCRSDFQTQFIQGSSSSSASVGPEIPDVPIDPTAELSVYVQSTMLKQGEDVVFTLALNKVSDKTVELQIVTESGSALENVDFMPASATVAIPPGQLQVNFKVLALVPSGYTDNKNMFLKIISASVAKVAQAKATATIVSRFEVLKGINHLVSSGCDLGADSVLRCFGELSYDSVTNMYRPFSYKPVPIAGLPKVSALGGPWYRHAVTLDGRVFTWGDNYGFLPNGAPAVPYFSSAVEVKGFGGPVIQLSRGPIGASSAACALLQNGQVQCWGNNQVGQLGNGTKVDSPTPVYVLGIANAISLSKTCAILADRKVKCWGSVVNESATPVELAGFINIVQLANMRSNLCALDLSGKVFCLNTATSVITNIPALMNAKKIVGSDEILCAVTALDDVKCAGSNQIRQLGYYDVTQRGPSAALDITKLQAVPEWKGAVEVVVEPYKVCAQLPDATVRCAGLNLSSLTGSTYQTTDKYEFLFDVPGLSKALEIKANHNYDANCAKTDVNTVKCWQQILSSSVVNSQSVLQLAGEFLPALKVVNASSVDDVTITYYGDGCFRTAVGSVKCWGGNTYGQLGNNSVISSTDPVDVVGLSGIKKIQGNGTTWCAQTATNTLKCWGLNDSGGLGNGTFNNSMVPVDVQGLTEVEEFATEQSKWCARTKAGRIFCWGYRAGSNSVNAALPIDKGIQGATKMYMFYWWGYAILNDGSVTNWFDSEPASSYSPRSIAGLSNVAELDFSGNSYQCALIKDGSVKCWGANSWGQLGDGTRADSVSAVRVQGISGANKIFNLNDIFFCAISRGAANEDVTRCWGNNQININPSGLAFEVKSLKGLKQVSGNLFLDQAGRVRAFSGTRLLIGPALTVNPK